jgi:ketopantoate reductase
MINKDLKVAVLGAGAMGCLFGGLLAEKGPKCNSNRCLERACRSNK